MGGINMYKPSANGRFIVYGIGFTTLKHHKLASWRQESSGSAFQWKSASVSEQQLQLPLDASELDGLMMFDVLLGVFSQRERVPTTHSLVYLVQFVAAWKQSARFAKQRHIY